MKLSLDIVENNLNKSLYSPLTFTKEEEHNLKQNRVRVIKLGFPRIPNFQLRTNTAIIEFLANICAFIRNYAHYKKRRDMRINAH